MLSNVKCQEDKAQEEPESGKCTILEGRWDVKAFLGWFLSRCQSGNKHETHHHLQH